MDGEGLAALKLGPGVRPKTQEGSAAPVTLVRLEVEAGEEAVDVKLNGQSVSDGSRTNSHGQR